MTEVQIRNAATVIVLRDAAGPQPSVLMGQRGKAAVFFPEKFVFPGGAVDVADSLVPLAAGLPQVCRDKLSEGVAPHLASALPAAAIRELWEETGLILGRPGKWSAPIPAEWQGFADLGFVPDASALRFVFRAITPRGMPRRFDARFFLVDAARLATDPDDFSRASDELSALQWVPLADARRFPLPFITEVVLAEVAAALPGLEPPASVPFFDGRQEEVLFQQLRGAKD